MTVAPAAAPAPTPRPLGRPSADLPQVLVGSPTDDELAAVAAVFATLAIERAASDRRMPPAPGPPTWNHRTRVLRDPRPREVDWTDQAT